MNTPQQLAGFCDEARQTGALDAVVISPPRQVFTATWVRLRCQYGCSEYGQCLTCPPHSPTPETTRKMLDE
jgi:predicted metal-binding protein